MQQQDTISLSKIHLTWLAIGAILLFLLGGITFFSIGYGDGYGQGKNTGYSQGWNEGIAGYRSHCAFYPFLLLNSNVYWACQIDPRLVQP